MTTADRKGIIYFSITDRGALYSSYMPFLHNGGVFVPTTRSYDLGDSVFMLLKIMNERELLCVSGEVVWLTPAGAQGNKVAGIGVQFADEGHEKAQQIIDQHLAASLQTDRATQTM